MLGRRVDPETRPDRGRRRPGRARGRPRLLPAQQAGRRGDHRPRHARAPDGARRRAGRPAGLPGRPPRRRHRGPADAHERRRARQPRRPPEPPASTRSTSPRSSPGRAGERGRDPPPARRCRARRRPHRPGRRCRSRRRACCASSIHEGRNRQVRRMCEAVGHPVTRLVRTRIGPLSDRRLRPGAWRSLTDDEVRRLAVATAAAGPTPGRPPGRRAGSADPAVTLTDELRERRARARVNVIGLGLIGGSIALGLRDAGWEVSGDDVVGGPRRRGACSAACIDARRPRSPTPRSPSWPCRCWPPPTRWPTRSRPRPPASSPTSAA